MSRDGAVSDIVGTALVLGVTLALVVVTAPALVAEEEDSASEPLDLAFAVEATPGESRVHLRHVGGDARQLSDLVVRVLLNDSAVDVALLGADVPWRVGERVDVVLPRTLVPDDRIEVTLVSRAAGMALPPVTAIALSPSAPPLSSAAGEVIVQFRDNADYAIANTSTTLYLQAKVRHPDGRKAIDRVVADLSSIAGSTEAELHDDGTHGDLIAHDSTYSAHFLVPYNAKVGVHPITVTLVDIWGARTTSRGELQVLERLSGDANTPFYNQTLFPKMGYLITKDPAKNTITIRLKTMNEDNKIVIDGLEYKLSLAHLEYPSFKPGSVSGTWTSSTNQCMLPVGLFIWTGELHNYDVDVDALPYYFRLEWKGNRGAVYTTHIEATPPAQYFNLRASEVTYSAGYPWTSFTDCTTT